MLTATFRVDHDAVALRRAFDAVPELEIEAERIAAHSTEWTMPCLWAAHDDFDAVDEALAADPTVRTVVEATEFADEKYYQVDWDGDVVGRVNAYVDRGGSILNADATAEGWDLTIRFAGHDQFDEFRETLTEQDHAFELMNLTTPDSPRSSFGGLTASQRDALVTAMECGYFEVPRETSTRELAEELDMAHQSLSELLRRGTGKLVETTLTTSGGDAR